MIDDPALVGREAELSQLDGFLRARDRLPGGAIIEGPAGAGKTTLWRAAVERARELGYVVLSCRPAGAEVQLSLAGLADLLEDHLARVLPALPAPQRRAIEVALLLTDDGGVAPDRRAITAGVLGAIRELAVETPVLVAIDDAQWLDEPSAEVIEFALRRVRERPVAVLNSWRTGSATATDPGSRRGLRLERVLDRAPLRIEVGPLSLGATHRLLRTRTSLKLNRRTLRRIHETSGGNPFYALELARAMERARFDAGATTEAEPLPLTTGLSELLADRLRGLGSETRDALFVAAALSQPTIDLVGAALGAGAAAATAATASSALAPAREASVVRVMDGSIEFVHPLLAAAAYGALEPADRRGWHARIAEVAPDPETQARHLALARPGRHADVAARLLAGARAAVARGAPGAAAELYEEAIDRLPIGGAEASRDRAAWIVEAAPLIAAAGATDRARALLETAIVELPRGGDRVDALLLLTTLSEGEPGGGGHRALELVDAAVAEAGSDARRKAAALLQREMLERGRAGLEQALPIARQALAAAEQAGDERLLAAAHVRMADLEIVLGLGGEPVARFGQALDLGQRVPVDAENSARTMLAVCLIRAGRLDEALPHLLEERGRAVAEGDEASHAQICMFLAELEWLAGNWDAAAARAAEGVEVAERAGLRLREGSTLTLLALVEASRGDPERARTLAVRARGILEAVDEVSYGNYARQVQAFLDLSLGDAAAANEHLETYLVGREIEGPKRIAFVGDAIEALVRLGDVDRAASLSDEVAARGARLHRPPLTATAGRCRALVLATRGDLEAATAAASDSAATFERLGLPFEHARSLLVLGEIQRRAKQRRAARETLTRAQEAFDRLGAHLWSARATEERARVGGRSAIEGLSETELRVARLVAEGRSNKEVAAELFVSVRAVESNLSKVYAKLGIRSRTELARRV